MQILPFKLSDLKNLAIFLMPRESVSSDTLRTICSGYATIDQFITAKKDRKTGLWDLELWKHAAAYGCDSAGATPIGKGYTALEAVKLFEAYGHTQLKPCKNPTDNPHDVQQVHPGTYRRHPEFMPHISG